MSIGLGIVGCGWAAGEIVRAAKGMRGLRIVSVFDTDAGRAMALAARAGADVAGSVEALIADPAINAVYVGLPHALLAPNVEQALLAGRHVLSEKPLATTAGEARRLGELAAARALKLAVFFELRRAGPVETARRLIQQGIIGTPRLVRMRATISKPADYWGPPGAPNWRARRDMAGGGVVMMNSIHQLDTLRYVTGLDYVRASGSIATFSAPADVEDAASATIELSNGGLVSLVASAHSPGARHDERIEIDGTLGRLDMPDPFGRAAVRYYVSATDKWTSIPVRRPDSHAAMLADFAASIANGGPVPAGASDAAAAVGAVEAIYRSAAERRTIEIT